MRHLLPLLLAAPLVGCVPSLCPEVSALPQKDRILAIGDSVLAWNQLACQAVPDHLALERESKVQSGAVSGTRMLGGDSAIPDQYVPDDWTWVIVDGGGNDLKDTCGTGQAEGLLDQLASPDGTQGAMAVLLDEILLDAQGVLLLGYYPMGEGAWYGFDACDAELASLNARYAVLAEQREGVWFVDLGQVLDPATTPEAYAPDQVHPDIEGAQRIAELLDGVMTGLEPGL